MHGVKTTWAEARAAGWAAAILALLCAPEIHGQGAVPVDGELQVNGYIEGDQERPAISRLTEGGFVVVWQSDGSFGTDASRSSIQSRHFDADGIPTSAERQVNTYTTGSQDWPAVSGLTDGGYVTVWHSFGSPGPDTHHTSIQGRRFDAGGDPLGDQFQVNTLTTHGQLFPSVAGLDDGGFVVVWHGPDPEGLGFGVQGQAYAADGEASGSQFRVNTYTTGFQVNPAVAGLADGGFVAVWESPGSPGSDDSESSIQARLFAGDGQPSGPQFQVNSVTLEPQTVPAVAALPGGGFVTAWQSWGVDGSNFGIRGQRHTATGALIGPEFQVNTYTRFSQRNPSVIATDGDAFAVFWDSFGADDSGDGIRGRRYVASGSSLGEEFAINTSTLGSQSLPAPLALDDGGFAVTWHSRSSAGSDDQRRSIQVQRFAAPRFALSGLAGKCLDVEAADPTDGTPVNLFRCNGGENQRWRFEMTAGPQRVVGLGDKCLVPGPIDDSGDTRVVIGQCGGAGELWRLVEERHASPSLLIHDATGLCLDVEGAVAEDGTPTILFDCHGGANQTWRPAAEVCTRDALGLCLTQDRFRVDLTWRNFEGFSGPGKAVPLGSDDSGLLWFFEEDNWEILIKALDGCAHNNRFWVFAAATTTVETILSVTDTRFGVIRDYFNPLGTASAAITDTDAFAGCSAVSSPAGFARPALLPPATAPDSGVPESGVLKGSCEPSLTRMCLSDGRFSAELSWRDFEGNSGSAQVVPGGSDDSGLFWFFDSSNWEMLIKVLDACDFNGRFWMLAAATTDVETTLRVTDTRTGVFRDYFNPLGNAAPALVDTFETCP